MSAPSDRNSHAMMFLHRCQLSVARDAATFKSMIALVAGMLAIVLLVSSGCSSGMDRIDRRVSALLAESSATLGRDTHPAGVYPAIDTSAHRIGINSREARERPESVNPAAADLEFRAMAEGDNVLARLEGYNLVSGEPLELDLAAALKLAFSQSREHRFAEEDYVISALRLLIERHRWGPQFFNDVSANVVASGDDGFFETSLQIVNEFRVTQRLPYGGTVSARALARAAEDLHSRVSNGDNQSAEFILAADIPLLRGAGLAAREERIQRERDLIYAAREFENFRRDFLFDIVRDFLDLVVQQRSVVNAERRVAQLRQVEQRERALYEGGRSDLFNAALAEQSTVNALDSLNQRREQYRLSVDRFKVRLGLPVEQPVTIVPSSLGLPVPRVELDEAVRLAMAYRLDLQTRRDNVDDARRSVAIARNNLLPDLDFTGSINVPSDNTRRTFSPEPDESVIRAGITFGLPLNREIERLSLRQSQIQLERAMRSLDDLRDNITVSVRGAVRAIDRARYTLEIQERSILIGEDRIESIEAAPGRATARDASEAADELLAARDNRDSALRDLELAILGYLLSTGQLRVTSDGLLQPLRGMTLIQQAEGQQETMMREFMILPGFIVLPRLPAAVTPIIGEDIGNSGPAEPNPAAVAPPPDSR